MSLNDSYTFYDENDVSYIPPTSVTPQLPEPRTIMIHELTQEVMDILTQYSRSTDIFTFDDGLYSNYMNYSLLSAFHNEKIFFYNSGILRSREIPPKSSVIKAAEAHRKLKMDGTDDFLDYMNPDELLYLDTCTNNFLGSHGHTHNKICETSLVPKILKKPNGMSLNLGIKDSFEAIKEDIQKSVNYHYVLTGTIQTRFCFPYNIENNIVKKLTKEAVKNLEKKLGRNQELDIIFYGQNRINVYDLPNL